MYSCLIIGYILDLPLREFSTIIVVIILIERTLRRKDNKMNDNDLSINDDENDDVFRDKKRVQSHEQIIENEIKSRQHKDFQNAISEKWKEIARDDINSIIKETGSPLVKSKPRTTSSNVPSTTDVGKHAGDLILEDIERRLNRKRKKKKSLFSSLCSCF